MSGQGSSGCCLCATLAMAKRKSQGPPRTLCKTWNPCRRRVAPGPHLDESTDSVHGHLAHAVSLSPPVPPGGIPGGRDWKQSSSPGIRTGAGAGTAQGWPHWWLAAAVVASVRSGLAFEDGLVGRLRVWRSTRTAGKEVLRCTAHTRSNRSRRRNTPAACFRGNARWD